MNTNMTAIDRAARVGLGLFLFATPILELRTYPYNLIGLVLMLTAAVGYCPIYGALRALFRSKHASTLSPGVARRTA